MKTFLKGLALLGCISLSFGAGYMVAKKKLDNRDQKELEEIKQYYEQKYNDELEDYKKTTDLAIKVIRGLPSASDTKVIDDRDHNSFMDPQNPVANAMLEEYDKAMKDYTPEKKEEVEDNYDYEHAISIISPLEYGDDPTYETQSLTYYSDGVLAYDDDDTVVDNIDDVIGIDALKHIGKYETGCIYVKNDISQVYYEITESDKTYSETTGNYI